MNKTNWILTGMIITFIIFDICLIKENKKIKRENQELHQEIIDYKWQLEQVPYLIEANLESWCNGE